MSHKLPVFYAALDPKTRRQVREQYIQEQNGLCYWCGCPLDEPEADNVADKIINWGLFPEGFTRYPVHLQHDRKTGLTEGAVHARCNAYMWQYKGR